MFSLIVAYDENRAIGLKDNLPWHIKDDLVQFKNRTVNHRLIMGYNTFKGMNRVLKNRHTIVACFERMGEDTEEYSYCTDLVKFLEENKDTDEEIFICGGASIYRICLPYCKKLYISKVKGTHEADTYFPAYDENDFTLINTVKFDEFDLLEYQKNEK